jgi:hypothetical protein
MFLVMNFRSFEYLEGALMDRLRRRGKQFNFIVWIIFLYVEEYIEAFSPFLWEECFEANIVRPLSRLAFLAKRKLPVVGFVFVQGLALLAIGLK